MFGVAGAILIAVTARVVGDDVKEWLPWITQRLVARAVSRLPDEQRDRFEEEWWANIDELPGNLAKVYEAWQCLSASKAIHHIALSGDTTFVEAAIRRATDTAMAISLLLILLPLMMMISIWIKFDSSGPVIYKQKRLGANNTPFYLLRFRSTYVDTPVCVTRVGRFIRIMGFVELPQLINVLRGEMSLVGPRPLPPPTVTTADTSANSETPILRRLKPGITGWDQIEQDCGRSDDWSYPQKQSLRFYFLILARTIVSAIMRDRRQ